MTKRKRTPDEILARLVEIRGVINHAEELRSEANALYIEGADVGLRATEMARAMQPEDWKYLAERVRQVIRDERDRRATVARKRRPAA